MQVYMRASIIEEGVLDRQKKLLDLLTDLCYCYL